MVEQRPGRRDAAPWVLEGGRRLPGHDDNRRLAALRARAAAPSRRARDRRRRLRRAGRAGAWRAARALLPTGAAAGVLGRAGRAPRARTARPAARHPGARRPRRRRPRGCAHGDHRGHSSCCRARASPTRSAVHPATTPALGGWRATATSTPRRPRCGRCASAGFRRWGSSTSICTTPTAPRRFSRRWPTSTCTRCTRSPSPTCRR